MKAAQILFTCFWLLAILGAAGPPDSDKPASLVRNGDFSQPDPADPAKPAHWDKPDGLGVQWAVLAAGEDGPERGRAIRLNTAIPETAMLAQWKKTGIDKWNIPDPTGAPVAGAYGLSYYSDAMPVAAGQAYRIAFRFKGASGGAKVWVRGYGLLRGRERRLYDTIVNCRAAGGGWTAFSQTFHPTASTPGVASIRVMLFATWPPGVYWFKDVAITPVPTAAWRAEHVE